MKLGIDLLQIIRPVVRRIELRAFNHAGIVYSENMPNR
jgi:hypothetical protein